MRQDKLRARSVNSLQDTEEGSPVREGRSEGFMEEVSLKGLVGLGEALKETGLVGR